MPRRRRTRDEALLRKARLHYDKFVELQGGEFCGICGNPPKNRRLNIDHDHDTGLIRGLLCIPCNRRLRRYHRIAYVRKMLRYLENPPLQGKRAADVAALLAPLPLSEGYDSRSNGSQNREENGH